MNSFELNQKLVNAFPEIKELYYEETAWQDGDETGSHVVYADVFVPFIKRQLLSNNKVLLTRIFDYIESLLILSDTYADEVVSLSVIESLVFSEDIDINDFLVYAKENTIELIKEVNVFFFGT